MGRIRKVRGKGGRLIAFRPARIVESIRKAVVVCGADDGVLADELAGVVVLFLEKRFDERHPPRVSDIREMVQKVLVETGHVRIARAFERLEQRDRAAEGPARPQDVAELEVVTQGGRARRAWDRARLARSLVDKLALAEAEARVVAAGVEERLVGCGATRASGQLVHELTDVELQQQGYETSLARHRWLGVPSYRVEEWLIATSDDAPDPEERVAGAVLEAYSLEEIHERAVSQAHGEGRIHVLGLDHPQRVEQVRLDARGPLFPAPRSGDDFLLHLVTLLQAIRPLVRRRITIARFSEAFAAIPRRRASRRATRTFVRQLLTHLLKVDVFGRPVFPPLGLEIVLTGEQLADGSGETLRWLSDALLDELDARPALSGRLGLTFVLAAEPPYHWPESETLGRLLRAARKHRGVALALRRTHETVAADRVLLDVGAVAVNVPYALALAGVGELDEVTGAVEGPIGLALDALFEKYWFLRRSAAGTLRGLLARLPGGRDLRVEASGQGGQVLLWGLPQALSLLERRGVVKPREGPAALARMLACVDYLAGEEREDIKLQITLGGLTARHVRARFLRAADELAVQLSDEDLAAALAQSPHEAATMPLLCPLLDPDNQPLLGGRFLRRMGPGLPLPARGDDEIAGAWWLRQLFESTALCYLELEDRGEVFEVQEELFSTRA